MGRPETPCWIQEIILLLNFRQDMHFQQKETIVNFFILTDNKLMSKSITHTTVLFSERSLARKAPWSRLSTSPTFCNSSVQVAIPPCPPHLSLLFVLQLKGALFLWWSKEKTLMGLPFYFLCMFCNFNFRFVESEAHIWKYGDLLFFSAFKYYDCTTEVINIPELIKSHIHR